MLTKAFLAATAVLLLAGCSEPSPVGHRNVEFGEKCLADGGAWTYSEGNEWDSCTIWPVDNAG